MTPRDGFAFVAVRCRECGQEMRWGFPVGTSVPEPLRCTPEEVPSGGGVVSCRRCLAPCFHGTDQLREAVRSALSLGWEDHLKEGAIRLSCAA